MKLVRIGPPGQERPAVLDVDGTPLDLSPLVDDVDGSLLTTGLDEVRRARDEGRLEPLSSAHDRFGPPIADIGKVVCVGLNYADHATETGVDLPAEPVLFLKTADTVIGANDDVLIPRGSDRTV
jgi:2-keto-4-pentenoate hydratase/2-oxohepta-3-ene-1,7-dioic acid hydratase in catechol pathway